MSEQTQGSPYAIYFKTWVILLVITVLMLGSEAMKMPRWFLLVYLLAFMAVKAAMIGGSFMHLSHEKVNLRVMVAAGLVITSLILFFFITPESEHVLDHTTKGLVPAPAAESAHH
jgi:caa(3)-type oxidase subunit IV